jgi:hypothetical protein
MPAIPRGDQADCGGAPPQKSTTRPTAIDSGTTADTHAPKMSCPTPPIRSRGKAIQKIRRIAGEEPADTATQSTALDPARTALTGEPKGDHLRRRAFRTHDHLLTE